MASASASDTPTLAAALKLLCAALAICTFLMACWRSIPNDILVRWSLQDVAGRRRVEVMRRGGVVGESNHRRLQAEPSANG